MIRDPIYSSFARPHNGAASIISQPEARSVVAVELARRPGARQGGFGARQGRAGQMTRHRRPPPASRRDRHCSAARRRSRRRSPPGPLAKDPASAFIDRSSLISRPENPMSRRTTDWMTLLTRWRVPRHREPSRPHARSSPWGRRPAPRRARNRCGQVLARRIDNRQAQVTVDLGAAVTGDMLHHRQHAALHEPRHGGACQQRHRLRLAAHRRGRRSRRGFPAAARRRPAGSPR
jgi:hypothetical protein